MSRELLDRVKLLDPAVATDLDGRDVWDTEEILSAVARQSGAGPVGRRVSGRWRLVAAFVAVLVLVGAIALAFRSPEEQAPVIANPTSTSLSSSPTSAIVTAPSTS